MKRVLVFGLVLCNFIMAATFGYYALKGRGLVGSLKKVFVSFQYDDGRNYSINRAVRISQFDFLPVTKSSVVFLGDSLTAEFNLMEYFRLNKLINRGIAGDTVESVKERIGNITRGNPAKVFLLIGINNLLLNQPIAQLSQEYSSLVNKIRLESPGTKIYVQSLLPVFPKLLGTELTNAKIQELNKRLADIAQECSCTFIDLYSEFLDREGQFLNTAYTVDGLHLNALGYEVWKNRVEEYVK